MSRIPPARQNRRWEKEKVQRQAGLLAGGAGRRIGVGRMQMEAYQASQSDGAPALFKAVQEQLGLLLNPFNVF